jgi:hypothetical protein
MHFGEIFLEVAIVFASLAILAKRNSIWIGSIAFALTGAAIALTTFLLH